LGPAGKTTTEHRIEFRNRARLEFDGGTVLKSSSSMFSDSLDRLIRFLSRLREWIFRGYFGIDAENSETEEGRTLVHLLIFGPAGKKVNKPPDSISGARSQCRYKVGGTRGTR
jgi:hypothetical protein